MTSFHPQLQDSTPETKRAIQTTDTTMPECKSKLTCCCYLSLANLNGILGSPTGTDI